MAVRDRDQWGRLHDFPQRHDRPRTPGQRGRSEPDQLLPQLPQRAFDDVGDGLSHAWCDFVTTGFTAIYEDLHYDDGRPDRISGRREPRVSLHPLADRRDRRLGGGRRLGAALLGLHRATAPNPPEMKTPTSRKSMKIGTYYYPEQWPREQWERDFD